MDTVNAAGVDSSRNTSRVTRHSKKRSKKRRSKNDDDQSVPLTLKAFTTKIWVDTVINKHKKSAEEFRKAHQALDALEADVYKQGVRWEKLIAAVRMPFKSSPIRPETGGTDEAGGDLYEPYNYQLSHLNPFKLEAEVTLDD